MEIIQTFYADNAVVGKAQDSESRSCLYSWHSHYMVVDSRQLEIV